MTKKQTLECMIEGRRGEAMKEANIMPQKAGDFVKTKYDPVYKEVFETQHAQGLFLAVPDNRFC